MGCHYSCFGCICANVGEDELEGRLSKKGTELEFSDLQRECAGHTPTSCTPSLEKNNVLKSKRESSPDSILDIQEDSRHSKDLQNDAAHTGTDAEEDSHQFVVEESLVLLPEHELSLTRLDTPPVGEDFNGIPNGNRKYLESTKLGVKSTPFEERIERALRSISENK